MLIHHVRFKAIKQIMESFVSFISKKPHPVTERVTGKLIRKCILDEIKKDYSDFSDNDSITLSELNTYRNRYIQNSLAQELGTLTDLEKQVIETMQKDETLSDKLLNEDKFPTLTTGQKLADNVAKFGGSWRFIILFSVFIFLWMLLNIIWLSDKGFDPYPFILLNLILSCLAAIQAPVIMMSQNRQEEKDRERAKKDYMINLKSELEIRLLHEKIDHLIVNQQERLMEIQQIQVDMMNDILERLGKKALRT